MYIYPDPQKRFWPDVALAHLVNDQFQNLGWREVPVVAVAMAEGWNQDNPNMWDIHAIGSPVWLESENLYTVDIGGWQLTSLYHIDGEPYPGMGPITFSDALDPFKATTRAYSVMTREGTRPDSFHYNLHPWTSFKTGHYTNFMARAVWAVNAAREENGALPLTS